MSQKHFLLKGTFILTVVGILTRVMGFFYRIFLSRSFPAEEIGLYQLIFPVYTLAYVATSAGIETALARLVAASSAKKQSAKAYSYLKAALLCSLFLSICCLFLLQKNAVFLTTVILVVTFWDSSRSGFLPSPNYLNSWSGSFLLSSSIQPMFIPLLHHLSQLLSSELSVVKLQPLFFASISSEVPGNLSPHTGSRLFLLFLPCFFLPFH